MRHSSRPGRLPRGSSQVVRRARAHHRCVVGVWPVCRCCVCDVYRVRMSEGVPRNRQPTVGTAGDLPGHRREMRHPCVLIPATQPAPAGRIVPRYSHRTTSPSGQLWLTDPDRAERVRVRRRRTPGRELRHPCGEPRHPWKETEAPLRGSRGTPGREMRHPCKGVEAPLRGPGSGSYADHGREMRHPCRTPRRAYVGTWYRSNWMQYEGTE